MPPVSTPALVLHVMPYRETSSIVRLLTRDLGLASAIARGARRQKGRSVPRLDLFAKGQAALLVKPQRELNTLAGFDVETLHARLADDVARFAAASALAEIALRCAPADPHEGVFEATAAGLDAVEHAPVELIGSAALVACWGLVGALGFSPVLDRCAVCSRTLEGALAFGAVQGGALCPTHAKGQSLSRLRAEDADQLRRLAAGRLPEPPLSSRHEAAHRRLLIDFIRHHLAEHRALPAVAFWDSESWTATSS